MGTPLMEELVRGHQVDRRAVADRWAQARDARAGQARRPAGHRGRTRTRLAGVLRAAAGRLEAGGAAVP